VTETNSVTGVAWYRREDWSLLREIASDRTKLDDSYEAWLAGAQKTLLELAVAGVAARRVNVDVEALVRWCRAEGRPATASPGQPSSRISCDVRIRGWRREQTV